MCSGMKQVDTSGLSFQEIREDGKYYVDKSLLIKDLLETNDRGGLPIHPSPQVR